MINKIIINKNPNATRRLQATPLRFVVALLMFLFILPTLFANTIIQTYFPQTEYEMDVFHIEGKDPGSTLMIIGGIHGDEKASYLAADYFADIKLKNGSIILIPRANLPSIMADRRFLNADMNRRFISPSTSEKPLYEDEIVAVLKKYMAQSDFLLNLHEGTGFYRDSHIDANHNPMRYGQSIIADAETFYDDKKDETIYLKKMAETIATQVNKHIPQEEYIFRYNNHNTTSEKTSHIEQRKSATYYGMTELKIPAFGIEISKQLPSQELKNFHIKTVVSEFMKYLNLEIDTIPSHDKEPLFNYLLVKIDNEKRYVEKNDIIKIDQNSRMEVTGISTNFQRGNYVYVSGFGNKNDLHKEFIIDKNTEIVVYKDTQNIATIPVRINRVDSDFAGFRLRILDSSALLDGNSNQVTSEKIINVYQGDIVNIIEGVEFEIVGSLQNEHNYDISVVGGTIQSRQGMKILDTGRNLSDRYAINPEKNLYEIIIKNSNKIIGNAYLKIQPIEVYGLHTSHNDKYIVLAPGDTLHTKYNDKLFIHDVDLNQLSSDKVKVNFAGYVLNPAKDAEDRGGDIILNNKGLIPSFSVNKENDLYEIHILYKQRRYATFTVSIK